jgi:hypothetical protein
MARPIPYYAQWESRDLAARIIAREVALADDPLWRNSGAASLAEYVEWANHVCGMACFKMVLAARGGVVRPTLELARIAVEFGGYVVKDGTIKGLIYAPFVEMARARFGMDAEVVTGVTAADLPAILPPGSMFMASVHPTIRWALPPPPKKGGHLVLVTSVTPGGVTFHNPSGHDLSTQEGVTLPLPLFDAFFAGRGVRFPGSPAA